MTKSNFILTDVMLTGDHIALERLIGFAKHDEPITTLGFYDQLHHYNLANYDRKFAVIEIRDGIAYDEPFMAELTKRVEYLHGKGFMFLLENRKETEDYILKHLPLRVQQVMNGKAHAPWSGSQSWFWFQMFEQYAGQNFNIAHENKEYTFLYLNKMKRSHRTRLYNSVESSGLLDRSLFTCWWKDIKLTGEDEDVFPYPNYGQDQTLNKSMYERCAYDLISETSYKEVFFTEKIWKPIIAGVPFIVLGKQNFLMHLRDLGFKTFGNCFNESYDSHPNLDKRIKSVVDLLKWLDKKEWRDIYRKSQSVRDHNKKHFFDERQLSFAIRNNLNVIFELFDCGKIPLGKS